MPSEYRDRIEELELIASAGDLSRGTRRLLDLCRDFELSDTISHDALELRQAFNMEAESLEDKSHGDLNMTYRLKLLRILEAASEELASRAPAAGEQGATMQGEEPEPTKPSHRETVFQASKLVKKYGGGGFQLELDQFELKEGELTGVVGENGNGKTTLLRIVAGDLALSSGKLHYTFMGNSDEPDWYRIKQEIAYIPQRLPRWFGRLKENLQFAASVHGIRGKENREATDFVIHRLGLTKYEHATWKQISTGYKLRFELARALVWHPRLLVLDEPLANLDINTRNMFLQDLRYLATSLKHPMAVILSSQQLHEVEEVSDHIVFLEQGKSLYNGPIKEFGKERNENVFELTSTLSPGELQARLASLERASLEFGGNVTIVHTPIEFTAAQFLQFLVEKEVPITYFREISTSTRKLFRKNHA